MGSIERRIEALEASFAGSASPGGAGARERLVEDFARRTLDAMAHVRRGPVDAPPWAYDVEGLRAESPVTVAAYVAALAALGHEDEGEAREILEDLESSRGLDPARHGALIDAFAGLVEQLEEPEARRGA